MKTVRDKHPISCIALSKDSKLIAIGADQMIRIRGMQQDIENKELICHNGLVSHLAFTSNQINLISISNDKTLRIWDLSSRIETQKIDWKSDEITSMVITYDDNTVIGGSAQGTIFLWKIQELTGKRELHKHTQRVSCLAVTKSNKILASGGEDSCISIWNIKEVKFLHTLSKHTQSVTYLTISNNDKLLASGSKDYTIRLWSIKTGVEMRVFTGHTGFIFSLAFSSDTEYIASASGDCSVKLWNIQSYRLQTSFTAHRSEVHRVLMFRDKRYLASSSQDGRIIIWNLAEGKLEMELDGPSEDITILEMTEDGKYIISASKDGTTKIWDLESLIPEYSTEKQISDNEFYDIIGTDYTWNIKSYTNIINRKENEEYDSKYNRYLIIPDRINILHIAAYNNDPDLLSDALNEGCNIIKNIYNESPITICLKRYSRSCLDVLLKHIIKLEKKHEIKIDYAIQSIENDILDIIEVGSEYLADFIEVLCKTHYPKPMIPLDRLPKIKITPTFVINKSKDKRTSMNDEKQIEIVTSRFSWNFEAGSSKSIDLLNGIYKSPNKYDILTLPWIRSLIDKKWDNLYNINIVLTMLYILNLGCITVMIFLSKEWVITRRSFGIVFLVVNLIFFVYEPVEVFVLRHRYVLKEWNILDYSTILYCILSGISLIMGLTDITEYIYLINIVCWFRGLSYLRAIKIVRKFVIIIFEFLSDSNTQSFLFLLLYTTSAYATILASNFVDEEKDFTDTLLSAYTLNLSDFETQGFTYLQWIGFILVSFLNCIIILNIFISVLGDTYQDVKSKMTFLEYQQKLVTIIEIENHMLWKRKKGKPSYLQVCKPVQNDDEEDKIQGYTRVIPRRIEKLLEGKLSNIENAQSSMKKRLSGIEESLDRFEDIMSELIEKLDN